MGTKITVKAPDFSKLRRDAERMAKAQRRAALEATDIAGRKAQRHIQAKMRAVGLGKLSNAVGFTSALKKRQSDRTPYSVIYARGGDDSLAGGALEAYSRGVTITANKSKWLAFPTDAVPRITGTGRLRRRLTAGRYADSGLVGSVGALSFRLINPNLALLVLRNVSLSPKTGRAKRMGPRGTRTRIPKKEVVAFVLIKRTRRAKRFDKDLIVGMYSRRVPDYVGRILRDTFEM